MTEPKHETDRFLRALDSALVKMERMVGVGELAGGQPKSLLGKSTWEEALTSMQAAFMERLDNLKLGPAGAQQPNQQFTTGELKQQAFMDLADIIKGKLDAISVHLQLPGPQMAQAAATAPDDAMRGLLERVAGAMEKAQHSAPAPAPSKGEPAEQATAGNWSWLRGMFGDLILLVTRIDSRLGNWSLQAGAAGVPPGDDDGKGGRRNRTLDSIRAAGSHIWQSMNEQRFSGFGREAFGAAGAVGGMIPGVGGAVSGLAKIGEVAFSAVETLEKWSQSLHNSNMQLAQFSISMAQVKIEQQFRDLGLNRQRGERLAPSARKLAEAQSEWNLEMAPLEDKIKSLKNEWSAWGLGILTELKRDFEREFGIDSAKKKEMGIEEYKEDLFTKMDPEAFFREINQSDWYKRNGRTGMRDRKDRAP